ncbi:MAG: metal-dependent hydrolase [Candidatus Competibacteraceae bacterium]|nr:metal-dependent hydrolase [Candidatus Competibacteraceae bacterium]
MLDSAPFSKSGSRLRLRTLDPHIAFASVLYLGGATLFGYRPDLISWALAAVASLLPDIDLPPSKIGRLFWFLSVPLERRFGHRTLTHSLVAVVAVAVLAWPLTLLHPLYWGSVVGGYGSHLWLDMLNIRGVDLFWPSPIRLVTPGNRNWRIAVGSKAEMMLLSVLLVLTVALYPLSHLGFRDALQALLKSFDIAVEQYQRQIGTHWYDLELVASDNLTLARVTCRCPVVGLWKGGLVVLQDGQPRAVGKSQQNHHLLPITGRLIEGEPLAVQAVRVEMKGRTLRGLLSKIDQRRVYFVNGEIQTGKIEPIANIELYRPVTYSGQTMTLRYARAQELGPWLDLVAAKGEIFVQFWLRPGNSRCSSSWGTIRPPIRYRRSCGVFID